MIKNILGKFYNLRENLDDYQNMLSSNNVTKWTSTLKIMG